MTREQLEKILAIAAEEGPEAALHQFECDEDERRCAEADGERAMREDPTGQDSEHEYVYGCGEYDTVDSKGEPLKPLYNDAGEYQGPYPTAPSW